MSRLPDGRGLRPKDGRTLSSRGRPSTGGRRRRECRSGQSEESSASFHPLLAYLYLPVAVTEEAEAQFLDQVEEFADRGGYNFVLLFVESEKDEEVRALLSLTDHVELLGAPDVLVVGPTAAAFEVLEVFQELYGIRVRTLSDSIPRPSV
jgi:hypothetical protein